MTLGAEATASIVFGIFMAIVALVALWQVAHYAARSLRSENMLLYLDVGTNSCIAQNLRSDSFELEA